MCGPAFVQPRQADSTTITSTEIIRVALQLQAL
ncbi:MAG: hypothetical protein RLZZ136_1441, partial [Pseudomonadota bacterium]